MPETSRDTGPEPALGFSVALCTYNGARHLGEQLASIAAQTLLPEELVISDDGSTDATGEIAARFATTVPFPVHFHRQAVNLGVTQNFAAALAACRGGLITLCDQDDVWLPDRLESFSRFFAGHPRCLALFSDATVVDEALRPLGPDPSLWSRVGLTREDRRQLRDPSHGLATLAGRYLVTGATLAVRRELLARALPIPQTLPDKVIHDGWIALVAAALGGLDSLPRATLLYRQHGEQQVGLRAGTQAVGGRFDRPRAEFGKRAACLAQLHDALVDRLKPDAGAPLDALATKAAFLDRRATRPDRLWRRLGWVARDFARGDYHRFCRWSVAAALHDLLP